MTSKFILTSVSTLVLLKCISGDFLMGGYLDNSKETTFRQNPAMEESRQMESNTDHEDTIAEESIPGGPLSGFRIPTPFAFNGGKPFSLEKDPLTGNIDFAKAPPLKALNYTEYVDENEENHNPQIENEYLDSNDKPKSGVNNNMLGTNSQNPIYSTMDINSSGTNNGANTLNNTKSSRSDNVGEFNSAKEKMGIRNSDNSTKGGNTKKHDNYSANEINVSSPSFHDFLNLPVRYSSDKYSRNKFPLISNSYANTKVQGGSNGLRGSMYNHKPYSEMDLKVTIYTAKDRTVMTSSPHPPTTVRATSKPESTFTTMKSTPTSKPSLPPMSSTSSTLSSTSSWVKDDEATRSESKREKNPPGKNPSFVSSPPTRDPVTSTLENENDHKDDGIFDEFYDYDMPESLENDRDYLLVEEDNSGNLTKPPPGVQTTVNVPKIMTTTQGTSTVVTTTTTKPSTSITDATTSTTSKTRAMTTATPMTSSTTVSAMNMDTEMEKDEVVSSTEEILTTSEMKDPGQKLPSFGLEQVPNRATNPGNLGNVGYIKGVENLPNQEAHFRRPVPESTSNIIVPPYQDSVSFILGNHQNMDVGYYVASATKDTPPGIKNEGSFRPMFFTGPTKPYREPAEANRINSLGPFANHPIINQPSNIFNTDIKPASPQRFWSSSTLSSDPHHQTIVNEIEQPSLSANPFSLPSKYSQENNRPQVEENSTNPRVGENPASAGPEKNSDFVVFPGGHNEDGTHGDRVIIGNPVEQSAQKWPTSTLVPSTVSASSPATTMTNIREQSPAQENGLLVLSESLTPPAERPRLPYESPIRQKPPGNYVRNDHHRVRPPLPHSKPSTHFGPTEVIFKRRYTSGADTKLLPNILPQFRPNAKTSLGHRGAELIGTLPAPGPGLMGPGGISGATRGRPPASLHGPLHSQRRPPFPNLQRLYPPPPPALISLPLQTTSPTQVSPSMSPHSHPGNFPPGFDKPEELAPIIRHERYQANNRLLGQKVRREELSDTFSAEPPQVPSRPLPAFPSKRTVLSLAPSGNRVATLQMIQQRASGLEGDSVVRNVPPPFKVTMEERIIKKKDDVDDEMEEDKKDSPDAVKDSVFVVYPVNSAVNVLQDGVREKDETVVVGTRGPHRPLPPDNLLANENESGENDEEGDNETDEKILPIRRDEGKPQSVSSLHDFPYPLERPDISFLTGVKEKPLLVPTDSDTTNNQRYPVLQLDIGSEENTHDSRVNVIPYLQDYMPFAAKENEAVTISTTLHRLSNGAATVTPIAYAYTPSSQRRTDLDLESHEQSQDHFDPGIKQKPILPSQQPSSSSSSAPSPQSFMAPFMASVSAEEPTKNGWSVINHDVNPENTHEPTTPKEKDMNTEDAENGEFDAENFKPLLFGGFKPIYEFPGDTSNEEEKTVPHDSEVSSHAFVET